MSRTLLSVVIKLIGIVLISMLANLVEAKTLKVSIPVMPVHAEANGKGILISFVKALEDYLEEDIDIELMSFSRAISYVSDDLVDFHLPLIKYESTLDEQHYIYSDETIFYVNFVLYSNKTKPVNINELALLNIETDSAHQLFFPFKTSSSSCLLCSLKRVQHQAIDGYIFADSPTDAMLKEHADVLKDVHRQLYNRFEVKVVFPKTAQGQQLNKKISAVIRDMRASGQLEALLGSVDLPFESWQLGVLHD